jgi:hypothetical protein
VISTSSLIDRLRGSVGKDLIKLNEVKTPYGDGFRAEVTIGTAKKECTLIQDKGTGEWKELGDESACQILRDNLAVLGTPVTGNTQSEKLREPI